MSREFKLELHLRQSSSRLEQNGKSLAVYAAPMRLYSREEVLKAAVSHHRAS